MSLLASSGHPGPAPRAFGPGILSSYCTCNNPCTKKIQSLKLGFVELELDLGIFYFRDFGLKEVEIGDYLG